LSKFRNPKPSRLMFLMTRFVPSVAALVSRVRCQRRIGAGIGDCALSLGCRVDDAEAFELLEPLREQGVGEPGCTSRISPKVSQPGCRLRMINGVQRSAKVSAPRAIGQYCPVGPHEPASRATRAA
jgi:hypothetical protein